MISKKVEAEALMFFELSKDEFWGMSSDYYSI